MLYLSLGLIAFGLFLVSTSIFHSRGERRDALIADRFVPDDDFHAFMGEHEGEGESKKETAPPPVEEAPSPEIEATGERPVLEDYTGEDDRPLSEQLSELPEILDESDDDFIDNDNVEAASDDVRQAEAPLKHRAVLYEDSTGLVDYESGESKIDTSSEAYSRLKRIGEGEVRIVEEGVVLKIGKELHRYDFYKIQDYRIGDNYIALYPKNSHTIRLLLVDGDTTGLKNKMQAAIEDYFRTAG